MTKKMPKAYGWVMEMQYSNEVMSWFGPRVEFSPSAHVYCRERDWLLVLVLHLPECSFAPVLKWQQRGTAWREECVNAIQLCRGLHESDMNIQYL